MNPPDRPEKSDAASTRRVAIGCALVALATCGIAVAGTIGSRDWNVTVLVRMASVDKIAPLARAADPTFGFVHPHAHYDGVYFYAIARDPLARSRAHDLIDLSAYRYGHPLYGWLAWLGSGGRPRAVPWALLAVNLVAVIVGAVAASAFAIRLGHSGWWGLIVALSPGIVFSTTADVGEPVLLAFVALSLLAWTKQRWFWAGLALIGVSFSKEPMLLIPAGLLVWELFQRLRGQRDGSVVKRLAAILSGPILFAGWYVYLHGRFGEWPFKENQDFLSGPLAGWVDTFRRAARLSRSTFDKSQLGSITVPLLALVAVALVAGVVRSIRLRTWIHVVFLFLALFTVLLGWQQLLFPKELTRDLAVQIALVPAVFAATPVLRGEDRGDAGSTGVQIERTADQKPDGGETVPEENR